jgi:glycosyltransferase involved in cell wall biosynthesis
MLSVIIACLNDEERLVRSLAALVPAAADGTIRDVIICDGGSADGSLMVADAAGCQIMASTESRASRLRLAALSETRADWLLFLEPGVILPTDFAAEAADFIERAMRYGEGQTAAAVIVEEPRRLGVPSLMRRTLSALTDGILHRRPLPLGLIMSRASYRRLGGHRPAAADPDRDLLARIGRVHLTILPCRARLLITPTPAPRVN